MNEAGYNKKFKWVLLVHQMPPQPTGIRVKIWRRLRDLGAVSIKNSIYVLPFTKQTYEIFQWLKQEIIAQKGEAMIFKTDRIEGVDDAEVISRIRRARDKEYQKMAHRSVKLKSKIEANVKKGSVSAAQKEDYETALKKLKSQLNGIVLLDYFEAPNRKKAERAVMDCSRILENLELPLRNTLQAGTLIPVKRCNKNEFQNKTWVTRKGIHIDRIASAWLIRRFIDKKAKFSFIGEDDTVRGGVGFDVYNAEFSHHGEYCTFEVLLKSFGLKDPILFQMAEVVHDIDLKDEKFDRKESQGIDQIITGLGHRMKNDKDLLVIGIEIFDALYQYYSLKSIKKR